MDSLNLGQIEITVEEIGPHNAPEFLKQNGCNRPYRAKTGEQYSRDQQAGAWREKPIPICMDENGNLINGQHTLNALILSGKTYLFLVARNVPNDVAAILDRGLGRSLSDVAHFYGMDIPARVFALARALEFGIHDPKRVRSFDEQKAAIEKHAEVINWIMQHKPRPWIKPTILTVVARAWYSQDRERLTQFVEVLNSGVSNGDEDSAAILLREHYLNPKTKQKKGALVMYQRTESVVMAFLERQPQKRHIRPQVSELFPLPGEIISKEKPHQNRAKRTILLQQESADQWPEG